MRNQGQRRNPHQYQGLFNRCVEIIQEGRYPFTLEEQRQEEYEEAGDPQRYVGKEVAYRIKTALTKR